MPTVTVLIDDKVGDNRLRLALETELPVSGVIDAVVQYLNLPRYTFFGGRLRYWFNRPYTGERLEGNMTLGWFGRSQAVLSRRDLIKQKTLAQRRLGLLPFVTPSV